MKTVKEEKWTGLYARRDKDEPNAVTTFPCEQEPLKPMYYVKCAGFWPVFKDTGSFSYGTTEVCSFKQRIEVSSEEEAEDEAARWNADGFVCPICGKKGKLRGVTGFELHNEQNMLKGFNRSALHMG